jgi:hypothetical protein
MKLYNYRTGEFIRTLTDAEAKKYEVMIANDTTQTGAVDGAEFDCKFTVFAN